MPNPDRDAPRAIREALIRFGGKNGLGWPLWRVCLAQSRFDRRSGIFHHMPDGNVEQFALDRDGKVIYTPVRAERVEHGTFDVPKYPCKGWILERYMPPHLYGTKEAWESVKAEDGITPMMGPFPSQGDYWMIGGPWEHIPEISDLETAVAQWECYQRQRPTNIEMFVQQSIRDEEAAWVTRREKLVADLEQFRKSEILPVLKSTSLSAQHVRNQVQEDLGLRSHLGVA